MRASGRAGGAMLFLVAAAVLFIEVMVLSLHRRSLDARWLSRKAHGRDVTAHLAWAARTAALAALRAELADPVGSRTLELLTRHDAEALAGRPLPLPAGWETPELAGMVRRAHARVDVEARLRDFAPLDGASLAHGIDRVEKQGLVETIVHVTLAATMRTYRYATPVKVVNLVPPVLTRFTLMVRRPERAGYNRYFNDGQGQPVERADSVRPLVVKSGTQRPGLVYLGGRDPLRLHHTAGARLAQPNPAPLAACAGAVVDRARSGFHAGEETALRTELASTRTAASSILHLEATQRVLGPVYRSVIERAAIAVDADGDGAADTRVASLPALPWHEYPWRHAPMPYAVFTPDGSFVDVSCLKSSQPDVHDFAMLFGDHASYAKVMSRVDDEPHDARGLDDGEAFALDDATGAAQMRGSLAAMAPVLEARVTRTVKDAATFLARHVKGDRLVLDGVVRIAAGDLELPPRLTVERGGTLIVPGRIVSRGVDAPAGQPLVLCSLGGDVELDADRGAHHLAAVALAGRLRATGASPLELVGSVVVDRLVPDDVKAGGTLTYDLGLDPAGAHRARHHRAAISLCDAEWMLP